jgi:hypothetical protein
MIPIISGTVAGQTVSGGSTTNPFSGTTAIDPNPWTTDTITISLLNSAGAATDANGTLTLGSNASSNFSETSPGVYVLTDQAARGETTDLSGLNAQLANLTFIPASGQSAVTTTFSISVDDTYNEHTSDSTTTVTASPGSGGSLAVVTATAPVVSTASTNVTVSQPVTAAADTSATATTTAPATTPEIHLTAAVAADQTETLATGDSHLVIDHPRAFHGLVDLTSGDIDLRGLAKADSYSFKNDVLSIFGAGKTLDNLRLTSASAFSVEKTTSGVSIYTADAVQHPSGTLLPLHG